MNLTGVAPLSSVDGLALFDAAAMTGEALLVPLRLDAESLRTQGPVPALFSRVVRARVKRATVSTVEPGGAPPLAVRLGRMSEMDREHALLNLVCEHTATVLAHGTPSAIDAGQSFKKLGF